MDVKTIINHTLVKSDAANDRNAYTEYKHIVNCKFASYDWQCPKVKNNLKVGGSYFARMEAKDGSFGFDFKAVYDEIILHKKIAYTLKDGIKVSTLFEPINNTIK